ncbi:glycoside hydrolase superfamily [Papiliotrema laurentii]|uniref:Glycoside hydrolase superfamily n=1 Tax=Papiliotrema laurentii TaxID=5418 RepID=A0AAD9CT75_PAPLA|nr:glycoside hydrolase superfamily [Papiliotrema laurentii]
MSKSSFVSIEGDRLTVDGKPILLKGAGLGGWMNMENFITGYPGHEYQMRKEMKKVLGEEKYEYFFDKFLEYFFTEDDAKLFSELGLNCLRLPINYRHFEDDMNPRVFKPEGLKHLDRVINLCAKYKIYTVIDLHAAPGGQNIDWHADAGNNQANFWLHKDFQDRAVVLWEHLAKHYKDNTWVAGYNPLNEPTDESHTALLAFYERIEKAIRAIDQNHILFLDGNTFGSDFRRFGEPLPRSVYACHDYSNYGFPGAPEAFTGTPDQHAYHQRILGQKIEYMKKHKLPIWNGEFGPVYANPADGPDWEKTNESRYGVLKYQLSLYKEQNISWSIWLWKDIGYQGMVYVKPDAPYMKLLAPFLQKKKDLAIDEWGCDDAPVRDLFDPIYKWMFKAAPWLEKRYPSAWKGVKHINRVLRECLLSEELCVEYASYFKDKSMEELDQLAHSFALSSCDQREKLNKILGDDTKTA